MSIAANLERVRERIALAAESSGRTASDITLVGVTKYIGAREAAELVTAGCHHLGESRPQELWSKSAALEEMALPPIRWHLVGHLQRNKVRRTLPIASLIHSVDSERLLAAIDQVAAELGAAEARDKRLPVSVLLEVNTSGDPAKHGLQPNQLEPLLAAAPNFQNVTIRGLMTMAAMEGGSVVAAQNFAALRQLRNQLQSVAPPVVRLDELSMGMSGDYDVGIREGATIVRIGSALWE